MTTDIRVVVPADIGETIKLGVKEPNKYDVDVYALGITAPTTAPRTIRLTNASGSKVVGYIYDTEG